MTADNPQLPANTVHYSYVDREYKPVPAADEHTVLHVSQDGSWAHSGSEGAAAQRAYERSYRDAVDAKRRERQRSREESATDYAELAASGGGASDDAPGEGGGGGGGGDHGGPGGAEQQQEEEEGALLQRNQFNYSERAAQCFQPAARERGAATVPVELHDASGSMSQWGLYDAYVAAAAEARAAAAGGGGGGGSGAGAGAAGGAGSDAGGSSALATAPASAASATTSAGTGASSSSSLHHHRRRGGGGGVMHSPGLAGALRALERLLVANAEAEAHADASGWEDASDAFKPGVGSLLPLWQFSDARGNPKRKSVTALAWSRLYPDLFAVGYGRYEYMAQGSGGVALYSLKNVASPEYVFPMDCGAMALAFHPQQPSVLAVGGYDGSVRVYDARRPEPRPAFVADVASGRHADPVWDVAWLPQAEPGAPLSFLSVSSDGRVARWVVTKAALRMEEVMRLRLEGGGAVAGEAAETAGGGGGGRGPSPAVTTTTTSGSAAAGGLGATMGHTAGSASASALSSSSSSGGGGGGGGGGGAPAVAGTAGLASGVCFDFSPFDPNLCVLACAARRAW